MSHTWPWSPEDRWQHFLNTYFMKNMMAPRPVLEDIKQMPQTGVQPSHSALGQQA